MVCFFKQKTADEMRMSDWSADVCSSDLKANLAEAQLDERRSTEPEVAGSKPAGEAISASAWARHGLQNRCQQVRLLPLVPASVGPLDRDRTVGVEGKSGSGGVDYVGRRSIKKTTRKKRITKCIRR